MPSPLRSAPYVEGHNHPLCVPPSTSCTMLILGWLYRKEKTPRIARVYEIKALWEGARVGAGAGAQPLEPVLFVKGQREALFFAYGFPSMIQSSTPREGERASERVSECSSDTAARKRPADRIKRFTTPCARICTPQTRLPDSVCVSDCMCLWVRP